MHKHTGMQRPLFGMSGKPVKPARGLLKLSALTARGPMISMDLARRRARSSEGRAERIFGHCRRRLHLWLGSRCDSTYAPAWPVLAPGAGLLAGRGCLSGLSSMMRS